jgi:hypothetical protein
LPQLASSVRTTKDWIYYSESILNDDGTITSFNIYRIKPGNWNEVQTVVRNNYAEEWIVFPNDTDKVYLKLYIHKKVEHIILDVNTRKFTLLPKEIAESLSSSKEIIPVPNTEIIYSLKRVSDKESSKISSYLVSLPVIPKEFDKQLTDEQ